jgi:hypothetical protein
MNRTRQIFFSSTSADLAQKADSRTTSGFWQVWKRIGCLFLMSALVGCATSPEGTPPISEGEKLFNGTASATSDNLNFWTIALKTFAGNDARQRAEEELAAFSRVRGLEQLFIMERKKPSRSLVGNEPWVNRAVICIGKETSPGSTEAIALLERVRKVRIDGATPFARAFYIPPTGQAHSNLDLRSAPRTFGPTAVYTLQVAAYGRADGKAPTDRDIRDARKKAEEAVDELRRQGELAFYYHGPSMSMVTIGVFAYSDIQQETLSYEIRSLMERFPHNLYNGKGVSQTVTTTDGTRQKMMQESFPVLIPKQ